ncbi:MAG: glycosyltransferase [Cyclobacteriaceae bacterium]
MASDKELRLALVVENFLPISQVWIWRQAKIEGLTPKVVLTYHRSNPEVFDFPRLVVGVAANRSMSKLRKKFWFVFKWFKPKLSDRNTAMFKTALQEYDVNIVHAHFGTVGAEVVDLCSELQIPLVVTFHGFDATSVPVRWPGYQTKLRSVFLKCACVVSISEYLTHAIKTLGCPPEKIRVNYLGVPTNCFEFTRRVQRVGPIRFIHIGRLVEKKGVPDLVRAFTRAFPFQCDVELMIVGSGEEETLVKSLTLELRPANPIVCKEFVAPEKVREELESADVFVLNSRVDSRGTTEGLPISMLEAMATGMPVIAANHAGIPEAVEDGYNGFLIQEKNIVALAEALQKCCDRQRNDEMGRNAWRTVRSKFASEENGKQLRNLYNSVVN